MIKISCVVPVYNESKRVEAVLKVLIAHPEIDEVIVVNDGSTDDSKIVLKKQKRINLISYEKNKGKTYALKMALIKAKNDWIMTIDSDLIGLQSQDITSLLHPIKNENIQMSMTMRKNSLLLFKFLGLDFVSGERVFRKDLIENLNQLDHLPRFGFESFLNNLVIYKKLPIKIIHWRKVITPRKSIKFGFYIGLKADIRMFFEIISVLGFWGMFMQILSMRKLRA